MITNEDISNTLQLASRILENGTDAPSVLPLCAMRAIHLAAQELSSAPQVLTVAVREYLLEWLGMPEGCVARWNDSQPDVPAKLKLAARSVYVESATV